MPLTFYRCSKCLREYDKLADAVYCEDGHKKVRRARAGRYSVHAYPYTVEVTFTDGSSKTYVLEELAHTHR